MLPEHSRDELYNPALMHREATTNKTLGNPGYALSTDSLQSCSRDLRWNRAIGLLWTRLIGREN